MNNLKDLSNKLPRIVLTDSPKKREPGGHLPKSKISPELICTLLLILVAIASFVLYHYAIKGGAKALSDSYKSAYDTEKDASYEAMYQKYYNDAESHYHVSNRGVIELGELREVADLEVLKVSDVEYIIDDSSDNGDGITAWLEVPGTGIYIVNLKASEFVVDAQRSHVLVRSPYPQLTKVTVDYANVNKLLFKTGVFNKSYKYGEELAEQMLKSAEPRFMKEFLANEHYSLSAQSAAQRTISCLVKQLNPENPELTVDVEFY